MDWNAEFLGNSLQAWAIALGILLAVTAAFWIFVKIVLRRLRFWARLTSVAFDDFLVSLLNRHLRLPLAVVLGLYLATQSLLLPAGAAQAIRIIFVVFLSFKAVLVLQEILSFALQVSGEDAGNASKIAMMKNVRLLVQLGLWTIAVLFVLNNLGINVSAAVAGLGIGGIAVALAAQAILGDTFSSFAIYIDKPFEVGDFIIVDDMMGSVEFVGFKTTRIRSLGGEQLVFPNSDLTSSRIRNYKRMQQRRVVFEFGVIYQTSVDQVTRIPRIVEEIIRSDAERMRFDRAHFKNFGDFALIFEVVYYVLSSDYNIYMDMQQFINVRLMEAFAREGIEFAYPTQQLYVTRTEGGDHARQAS